MSPLQQEGRGGAAPRRFDQTGRRPEPGPAPAAAQDGARDRAPRARAGAPGADGPGLPRPVGAAPAAVRRVQQLRARALPRPGHVRGPGGGGESPRAGHVWDALGEGPRGIV